MKGSILLKWNFVQKLVISQVSGGKFRHQITSWEVKKKNHFAN